METAETVTQVIEVVETIDYSEQLNSIMAFSNLSADASVLIAGILVFFLIVVLCYFAYKFFRIFF